MTPQELADAYVTSEPRKQLLMIVCGARYQAEKWYGLDSPRMAELVLRQELAISEDLARHLVSKMYEGGEELENAIEEARAEEEEGGDLDSTIE